MTHTKDEALKLALEALETLVNGSGFAPAENIEKARKTITAIKQALAAPVQEPVAHQIIAGALFDFMGFLTSRNERLMLSSADNASPVVEAITNFAKMRGLSLDDARVEDWQDTTPPAAPVQEPVACECNQGQVCHVCDPITPSKQSAQQEPAFWYYTLVVEGQVVGENFTTVNWDTTVEPFGRYDIDHGGKVTKQPLYTTPPAARRQWVGLTHDEYDAICNKHSAMSDFDFLSDIEAKLKEKNNG